MTVANNYAPARYVGNGSTRSFAVSWRLENDDDFVVYQKVGDVQSVVDPSNYTAVNTDNEHGVVFNTAPAKGTIIVITRATPHEQDTPYKTSSGFQAIKVEEDFDSLTMMIQELQNGVDRAVKVPETSTETQQHFSDSLFTARDKAKEYAQAAHVSEGNAAESATNAHYSEENAQTFAGRAETAATTATNKANEAANSAITASQKETLAQASATRAYQSELNAKDWAVSESLVDDTYYGARHYARLASESADDAYASSTNAETQRGLAEDAARVADAHSGRAIAAADLSMQWAIKMDGKVDDYEYSAKYWAEQSASSLSGLQSDVAGIKAVIPASATAGNKLTDKSYVDTGLSDKQDTLVSGSNIKTINNQSILGSGDLSITESTAWGNITGTLSNQTDLQNALDAKANNADLASVATSGSYNDLSNKPDLSVYALDNAVVHLSGNETIAGKKIFTENLVRAEIDITKGTNPSSDKWNSVELTDKNGAGTKNRVGVLESAIKTNGDIETLIGAYKYENDSTTVEKISVTYPKTGNPYTYAPTPSDTTTSSGTQIATTGWVNSVGNNVVHRTGNETIDGTKTFVIDPYIKNPTPQLHISDTTQTKGTAPSADVWGGITFQDANDNLMGKCRQLYTSGKTNMVALQVYKANSSSDTNNSSISIRYPASGNPYVETGAYLRPSSDNSLNLGDSSHRWKQLYAGTTTISTSDERLKQDIENISDEILDVWGKVEFYRYKFKDAVAEKGKNARYHTGLIAQRIERIFAEHGLNAFDYGLLCYDEWQEQKEEKDEEGNIITPKIEAGNRYSLRYEECLCMEAAYQRYRADKIEARLAALEARV